MFSRQMSRKRFSHNHIDFPGPIPPLEGSTYVFITIDLTNTWLSALSTTDSRTPDCATTLVRQWKNALRHLSEHCEFTETLNDRLCEKFVTGLNNSDIQRKLILERDLTIDKAIHLAASMERSHEAAKAMGPPALNTGHIAKACLSKTSASSSSPQRGSSRRQNQSHHQRQHFTDTPVQAPSSDALPEFNLFSISSSNPTPINVQITVNGKNIEFQLDTGAALTFMTEKDFHTATDGTVPLQPCQKQLQTYTG
ncbi:hypothetical protein RRG08_041701 [Elysia crispata]|uniref:Uncharacterized protein n=1 Tax=Elysia crispata TaxID=231223 RepID=A0AAE1B3T1_9GAST|nr:hypothetical protein RRG08_041701 [Elysia crispata]